MTIDEAIGWADALRPNTFSREHKLRWLSELDGRVVRELIETLVRGSGVTQLEFVPYTAETAGDTVLLVPPPYDEMYLEWLRANLDRSYEEFDKFNNSIMLFNTLFSDYRNEYNRTHLPRRGFIRFW